MELLRTPDDRFADLPGFPYAPRHVEVGHGARMAYVDEGEGETLLLLHGEPTWSFLYRKVIAGLLPGHRVVAPDLLGFGRSDKPARVEDHTFALHLESLVRFLEKSDLRDVTLVCQDWGGLFGLRAVAEVPDRFARLVVMNTGLPDGTQEMPPVWLAFRRFVRTSPVLPVGWLVGKGCRTPLPDEAVRAYDAPFPDRRHKAGPRALPQLVPTSPDMEAAPHMVKAREFLRGWKKPALVLFSDRDPITRAADPWFRKLLPTAGEEPHVVVRGAGHFLQEDAGEEVAREVAAFVARRPLS